VGSFSKTPAGRLRDRHANGALILWRRVSDRRTLLTGDQWPVNILLLQLKRIGDLILTLPAIATLRENFPAAQITLAISSECADLLPAVPNVNRILLMRRNLRDLALFLGLAREKFDYCVDFTRTDRSALLVFLSGARKRIVYRRRDRFQKRARVYSDYVKVRKLAMHTVDYNLALIGPLGVRNISRALRLELPQEAREKTNALRRDLRINEPYLIFHPGSARAEKFWQPQRWADVIEHARSESQISVVLTGGVSRVEQKHLREVKGRLRQPVVDLSGKTDLLTLAALIERARLLVTVDSAPMHLAAATQTPQVILFGPTNPFHWRPLESPALILQGESATPLTEFSSEQPCLPMRQISTAAVIGAMDLLLLSPHATTTQLHEQGKT
jgi:predicted lipopolysaccharide heptosyltransferase III